MAVYIQTESTNLGWFYDPETLIKSPIEIVNVMVMKITDKPNN